MAIAHGSLFIVSTPQWEGFDESFHYAYIQHIAETGEFPVYGKSLISRELTSSFRLLPHSAANNSNLLNRYTSYPDYWRLSESVRKEREHSLRSIPKDLRAAPDESAEGMLNYEAQQAPLYYLVCAAIYRFVSNSDQPTLAFVLRCFSLLLGSLTVFIAFQISKEVNFPGGRFFLPLTISLLPMFFSTVCRISNDSLGVPLFSALILLTFKYVKAGSAGKYAVYLGIVAGLGLLTKAYFLTALPAVVLVLLIEGLRRSAVRAAVNHLLIFSSVCLLVAGWWYARNYYYYGTLSGIFLFASAKAITAGDYITKLFELPWRTGLEIIFRQQVWAGNTSFMGLSKVVYRSAYLVALLAFFGVVKIFIFGVRRKAIQGFTGMARDLGIAGIFYLMMIAGLLWQMLATYIVTNEIVTGGWYLNAVVIPAIVIVYYGLAALFPKLNRRLAWISIVYVLLINFLAYFCKAIPYYAGFIIPRFHLKHFFELYTPSNVVTIMHRLALNKPEFLTPAVIGACITCYIILLIVVLFQFRQATDVRTAACPPPTADF